MLLPYTIDPEIASLLYSIAEKQGQSKAMILKNPSQGFIEKCHVDSIFATLKLDGSGTTRAKVSALLKNGPQTNPRNLEVKAQNLDLLSRTLKNRDPKSQTELKQAYLDLSLGLDRASGFRKDTTIVIQINGAVTASIPAGEMRKGMKELFLYLRHSKDEMIIKSCLAHYYIFYFQPFDTDNEIMARLWQRLLLVKAHPSFEFNPWEMQVLKRVREYAKVLPVKFQETDVSGFINFMLRCIDQAYDEYLDQTTGHITPMDRIEHFHTLNLQKFSRRDYMQIFKTISTSTASRDLELGVSSGIFEKSGEHNKSVYSCLVLSE